MTEPNKNDLSAEVEETSKRQIAFAAPEKATAAEIKMDEDISDLLDPEHPLLEKFQRSLKEHLLRQIEHLQTEISDLEGGTKETREKREKLGMDTYEAQQFANKQQEQLEMCVVELDNICSASEQLENQLEEEKKLFSQKQAELFEEEKKELRLRREVESLNLLTHQMKGMEEEIESELAINQRVFEKTKKDKYQLAVEKRQLDMLIYNLLTEIWRLEEELQTMEMQIRVKEEEREKLADAVATGNTDLSSIASENRALLSSWNSIIVTIGIRDNNFTNYRQQLNNLNDELQSMSVELDRTKKLCSKEMLQNENLTSVKCRIQDDINTCIHQTEIEKKKRNNIELTMANIQSMIDKIESDITRTTAENKNKSLELALLYKDFEKASTEKCNLDMQIMRTLEEQIANDKAAKYVKRLVYQVKEKNKELEILLSNMENSNARTLMDIESQKCLNEETQRFLDDILKQQRAIEDEIQKLQNKLDELDLLTLRKQRDIDVLSTKIEAAIKRNGDRTSSVEEEKVLTLEKNIEEVKEEIKRLQKFWLRQQGHVVGLSQQRQDQINDINMLKKQLQLLVQKNLKINDEVGAYKKQEEKLNRCIIQWQNQLVHLSEKIFLKKDAKEVLSKENDFVKFDYIGRLEDLEMESIKIQADITDIEEDKLNLSNELIELNREALAWEKKIQMTLEAKTTIKKESGGEINTMKVEIHRMEVRCSQLRKAQEKLIQDLEHCVFRRESIINLAEAREKKEKGGSEKTRFNFHRKMDDIRNKTKQVFNELDTLKNKIEMAKDEEQKLTREIALTQQDITFTKRKIEDAMDQVEQTKTDRQKNLELLVMKQKKLKVYALLAKGHNPFLVYRTESAITSEYNKQKELNNNLISIVENLFSDFPNHRHILTRIYNTLQMPLLYLYQ